MVFSISLLLQTRIATVSVSDASTNVSDCAHAWFAGFWFAAEYAPQAYLQSDLQMFAQNYSTDLLGKEPIVVSIDGGKHLFSGPRHV
jgi:hypothetical protein